MKKIYIYLSLVFILLSCDNKEDLQPKTQSSNPTQTYIINGDIEYLSEITDGSKPTKPIFVYDIPEKVVDDQIAKNTTSKTSEEPVIINFAYGIGVETNSGCTIKKYNNGNSYYTDAGVFGPNPYSHFGHVIRGCGRPHLNFYYGSLVLFASNRGNQATASQGQIYNDNISEATAISIEHPFKANFTYEISLTTYFNDNRPLVDNITSSGFPTVYVQLKDSGIIMEGPEACKTDHIIRFTEINPNNLKTYVLEDNIKQTKILTFKFSPTEAKKALVIAINPKTGERGINTKIPTNSYTMSLHYVEIKEKPFDPSLIVPLPPGRR